MKILLGTFIVCYTQSVLKVIFLASQTEKIILQQQILRPMHWNVIKTSCCWNPSLPFFNFGFHSNYISQERRYQCQPNLWRKVFQNNAALQRTELKTNFQNFAFLILNTSLKFHWLFFLIEVTSKNKVVFRLLIMWFNLHNTHH